MHKLLLVFAITTVGFFTQEMELLSKKLPIFIQVNNFVEKNALEIFLQDQLMVKKFTTISKSDLETLVIAESKKAVQMNAYQVDLKMNMSSWVNNAVNSMSPVAQKLTVTIVTDKQGSLDSCYLEIANTPAPLQKKRIAKPRLYIADCTVKKNDLQILAKEIIAVSTGIKESSQ